MSDLTAKFTALEEQLAAQAAVSDALVDTVEDKLQLIFDTLDTMLINNAANTRYLLAALGQNSPCASCDPVDISVPPVSGTTKPVDVNKCKRTQAFLHAMTDVYTVLDTMSAFGVPFTPSLITDGINAVITALANSDPTPLASFPEMVQLVGDGVNYVAGGFLVGDTLVGYFMPILFDLRDAIYNAGSISSDQEAFNALIDSTGAIPAYAKPLMKHAAYNELWSFYFDPTSGVNLTGYDGTICNLTGFPPSEGCIDIEVVFAHNSNGNAYAANWPGGTNEDPVASITSDSDVWGLIDISGYTITCDPSCTLYLNGTGATSRSINTVPYTIDPDTNDHYAAVSDVPFTLQLCVPE